MFRFALVTTDGESHGVVAFARPDFNEGEVIPQGQGHSLRVVRTIEPETADQLPILVVELAN